MSKRHDDAQHTKVHQVLYMIIVLFFFAFIVGMQIGRYTSSGTQVDREPSAYELLQRIP